MPFFDFLSRKPKAQPVLGDPNTPGGVGNYVGQGGYGEGDGTLGASLAAGGSLAFPSSGASSPAVSEFSAVTLSAVWACVRVIAESVAQLPLLVLEKKKGSKRLATEHPAYGLLSLEPNPRQSAFSFIELMVATCLLWGNAYAIIERDRNYQPIGLHWVHPRNVAVIEYQGELFYWITGEAQPRAASEMLHIAGLGFNGVTGRSVLSVMRENIALGLSAQAYGTNFYANGTHLDSVLESANPIKDEKVLDRLRNQFQERYSGLKNSHKPLLLEAGIQYKRIGMPPADAQFIETRAAQADEIARFFRVPPHKIGILERSTNNNIEHQGLEFVTDTLNPWLTRFEQEFRRKLLREDQKGRYTVKFDYDGLLRGDYTARANFYKSLWGVGVLSANDIADMEDRDHVEGGDTRYVPLNMVPTDLIREVLLKNPPKPGENDPKTPENEPKTTSKAPA